ncbi:hypothetical protein RSSM_06826 [Rhodopirellula sallentina SM41]|uniref:Uncharacterized protein n=1 Tax=Rhodopirellula sallentina SM41 TaxID=1263870 RepID=M5U725_9BACT|nr:hypothetical protein RSSM_06826 [Rhodopirellula sallentina SM41]
MLTVVRRFILFVIVVRLSCDSSPANRWHNRYRRYSRYNFTGFLENRTFLDQATS